MKKLILAFILAAVLFFCYKIVVRNSNLSEPGEVIDKILDGKVDSSKVACGSIYEKTAEYRQTSTQKTVYNKKQVCKSNTTYVYCVGRYKTVIHVLEGIPYKTESDTTVEVYDFYGKRWYKYPAIINNNVLIKDLLVRKFMKK